ILQLLLCLVIAAYIMTAFRWRDWRYWLAVLCVSAFMQTFGFRGNMGIIDASIVYTFFYAFPLWLLLVFFFPFFQAAIHGQTVWTLKRWQQLTWPLLIVFLAFSGPLVAPLAILVCGSLLAFYLVLKKINLAPYTTFILSLMLGLSLYSMYVGSFNLENGEGPSILERFMLMPTGLAKMLFTKIGWPLILILFGLSLFLFVKKGFSKTYPRIWQAILFLLAVLGVYVLLLPFGGYRPYRPYIIRYDTFLPGTIIMIMCLGMLARVMLEQKPQWWYALSISILLLALWNADRAKPANACEKTFLYEITQSPELPFPDGCAVLSWKPVQDPAEAKAIREMLGRWGGGE
ncbi:MAG: hypothetical protein AB8F95_11340, partial [Bacteroidia bacterium]